MYVHTIFPAYLISVLNYKNVKRFHTQQFIYYYIYFLDMKRLMALLKKKNSKFLH